MILRPVTFATLLCLLAGAALAFPTETPPAETADLTEASERVRARDYAVAEELLYDLQEQFPEDARVHLMLGEVLLALGEPGDAREILEKAASLSPDSKRVHFQLGSALAATGDAQAALASYAKELEINDDPQIASLAHMNRSLLLRQLHRWDDSAAELEAFLALNPEESRAFGDLVALYLRSGKPEKGAEALERGAERSFVSAQHRFDVGAAFYQAGNTDAAVRHFEGALAIDPEFADAERAIAAALDRLDRRAEATSHLRRYLELRPDAPDRADVERRIAEDS